MGFNDENFMLNNHYAQDFYTLIKDEPIFDYHCHLDPKEIYEDKVYDNIVDLWLGHDHYKWRLMRANGVSEEEITGDASKLDKFKAFAKTLEKAFGNPVYHWSLMELKNIFKVTKPLTQENAEELYDYLNHYLVEHKISPRKLIEASRVTFIGTTDNPLDDLGWHKKLAADETFKTVVAPTFRPDEAFVNHANFSRFIERLAGLTHIQIDTFEKLVQALEQRIVYFKEHGCKASDISFQEIVFQAAEPDELNHILAKRLEEQPLSIIEQNKWQTALFSALCALYKQYGLVTQVHFGALRNNHSSLFKRLGADIGVDSLTDQVDLAVNMNRLLDELVMNQQLPKMIWYNLNPNYNVVVANTLANFQANEEGVGSYLQFGASWWFADTKLGMINQMNVLAEQGLLANFVGMLTDSRSFLSYQRHDYFRRILCNYIGKWVEQGEIPANDSKVNDMLKNIAYYNAVNYFKN